MSKIGKVSDIATQDNLGAAFDENRNVFIWGKYFDQEVSFITQFSNMHDIFKYNMSYIIDNLPTQKKNLDYTEKKSNILECLGEAFNDSVCFVFYLISAHCAYNFSHCKMLNKIKMLK